MALYHINTETKEPGVCSAEKKACPFALEGEHFTSYEAAYEVSNKLLSGEIGWESITKKTVLPEDVRTLMSEIAILDSSPVLKSDDPEDQTARKQLEGRIAELRKNLDSKHPWGNIMQVAETVTSEDVQKSIEYYASIAGNDDPEYAWGVIMGEKTRFTQKNIDEAIQRRREKVSKDPKWQKRINSYARNIALNDCFARAIEKGIAVPSEYDNAFQEIWEGPEDKHGSKLNIEKEIAQTSAARAGLERGDVSAAKIIGKGYRFPKAMAKEYLEERERKLRRQLATRGRSTPVSVSNIMLKAKEEGWELSNDW